MMETLTLGTSVRSPPPTCRDKQLTVVPQAAENLVGYSSSQPAIFKTAQLTPIKDLKLLVKDHPVGGPPRSHKRRVHSVAKSLPRVAFPQSIAKNAVTILVNLSADPEVLEALATDDAFVESVLTRLLVRARPLRPFPRR